jgi:hypothetical protein
MGSSLFGRRELENPSFNYKRDLQINRRQPSNSLYENFFITFAGTDCQIRALLAGFGNPAKP